MVALLLTEAQAEMLLTGAVGLSEDFDGVTDVLSAIKDLAVPDPDADFSHLIAAAAQESRLTPAEMLLTGAAGFDEDFDGTADVLSAIKDLAVPDPDADFSHLIAAAAQESRLTPFQLYATEREPPVQDWQTRLIQRVAPTVAALVALVMMSGAMTYAANGANPGDLLYGLDRALEAIGIGNGGAEERRAEAFALFASGVEPSDVPDTSEMLISPPTSDLTQEAPITGTDGPENAPPLSVPPEEPREGRLADDPDKDRGSINDKDGSTGGRTNQSSHDTDGATDDAQDDGSGDPGPTDDPSDVTNDAPDDGSGDPGPTDDPSDATDGFFVIEGRLSKDGCKDGGWQMVTRADGTGFVNQGDCVQFTLTGR
jgi:hypothetical protein